LTPSADLRWGGGQLASFSVRGFGPRNPASEAGTLRVVDATASVGTGIVTDYRWLVSRSKPGVRGYS